MGSFSPVIEPFNHVDVEKSEHPILGIVFGGLVPPLFRPAITTHPLHRRRANHAPPMLGADLGGLKPPFLLRQAPPPFAEDTFGNSTLRNTPKHHRPLLRPRHFVGFISFYDITFRLLANFENGAEDTGTPPGSGFGPSPVLPSAHN